MKKTTRDTILKIFGILEKIGADKLNDCMDVFDSKEFKKAIIELAMICSIDEQELNEVRKYMDKVNEAFLGKHGQA